MSNANNKPISEKLARLEELVGWFESDEFTLEEALERFNEAEKLSREIETDLKKFKNTITVLKKDFSEK